MPKIRIRSNLQSLDQESDKTKDGLSSTNEICSSTVRSLGGPERYHSKKSLNISKNLVSVNSAVDKAEVKERSQLTNPDIERLRKEVDALKWLAKRKEQEWDKILSLLKLKERSLVQMERKERMVQIVGQEYLERVHGVTPLPTHFYDQLVSDDESTVQKSPPVTLDPIAGVGSRPSAAPSTETQSFVNLAPCVTRTEQMQTQLGSEIRGTSNAPSQSASAPLAIIRTPIASATPSVVSGTTILRPITTTIRPPQSPIQIIRAPQGHSITQVWTPMYFSTVYLSPLVGKSMKLICPWGCVNLFNLTGRTPLFT